MPYQHLHWKRGIAWQDFGEKGQGYPGSRANAPAAAAGGQPGVGEEPGEKGLSSLWGIQQGKAPGTDAAQAASRGLGRGSWDMW